MAANKESVMASSYRDTLDSSDRVRYDAKLSLIGNRDPYAFEQSYWTDDVSLLPSTTYIDIMNYLVFSGNQVSTVQEGPGFSREH